MVTPSSTTSRLSSNTLDGAGGPASAGSVFAVDPIAESDITLTFAHGLGHARRIWHCTSQMLASDGNDDALAAILLDYPTALPPAAEPLPAAAGLSAVIESVPGARP